MNRVQLFNDASEEVQVRAQLITRLPDLGEARKEYYKAFGYICALRDTGLFDSEQYGAAADLLNAAIFAVRAHEKKAAPDGSNTGNGSKGGHPKEDDSLTHNLSVVENSQDVKAAGATAQELAYTLYKLIRSMQGAKIGASEIVFLLLTTLHPEKGEGPHAER